MTSTSAPSPPPSAEEQQLQQRRATVFGLLDTAARLTRRLDSALSIIKGISFSEYQMLAAIRDQPSGAITRVDLATHVGLTPSGVTRALKPLEKLGFVETVKDARDARKSLAKLTASGDELISDADGVVNDTLAQLGGLSSQPADEQQRFLATLASLA